MEPTSSRRISFSADLLDDKHFISVSPNSETQKNHGRNMDFEFLSSNSTTDAMLTADELFFEGKLLPFLQMQHTEKLSKISIKPKDMEEEEEEEQKESRVSWFIENDPSPRPPKCTVLWKELLRLKKQRASTLSPSSSSSSSSSGSLADICPRDEGKAGKEGFWSREKHVKRIKKRLERTRSASFIIRPFVHVPPCTQGKNSAFPILFSLKKGSLER